jgi:integrase
MPYTDVPAFLDELRDRHGVAALALEFALLTACRTNEVLGARWSEFDLEARVWTIPGGPKGRMKTGREHRVPLSDSAMAILAKLNEIRISGLVFPGLRRNQPLSPSALEAVLRRMKIKGATVHGMRSSFRDWAGNETGFPREVAEQALAHVIGDAAEQAYRRGDALEKRRKVMAAWSEFLNAPPDGNVLKFERKA